MGKKAHERTREVGDRAREALKTRARHEKLPRGRPRNNMRFDAATRQYTREPAKQDARTVMGYPCPTKPEQVRRLLLERGHAVGRMRVADYQRYLEPFDIDEVAQAEHALREVAEVRDNAISMPKGVLTAPINATPSAVVAAEARRVPLICVKDAMRPNDTGLAVETSDVLDYVWMFPALSA
jgi:hypothetical protein